MEREFKPLDHGFNIAVHTVTNILLPSGYDITDSWDEAPSSLEQLRAHVTATGRILVWSGASDATIFDDRETNWAFRAWHDWTHWRHDLEFDAQGEYEVCQHQKADLEAVYGRNATTQGWNRILEAEIIGQVQHNETYGYFPVDQMAFARQYLAA